MPGFLTGAFANGAAVEPLTVLARLVASLILGLAVAWIYRRTTRGGQPALSLPATLVLLCILIAVVTQVIGDNVARAFSLVGALSIVRFRTVVRDTRDTAFVIFAVVTGMAIGAGQPVVAILGIGICGAAAFGLAWRKGRGGEETSSYVLRVRSSPGVDVASLAAAAAPGIHLRFRSIATARQGASVETEYLAALPKDAAPGALAQQLHRMEGIHEVRLASPGEEAS